jgi:hypothetical protein
MVQLNYSGNKKHIFNAVAKANQILQNPAFYSEIGKFPPFHFSSLTPIEITKLMENSEWRITVRGAFKPIANASTSTHDLIKVSTINFSRDLATGVNTLIHETVHAIDLENGTLEFTHDGNSPDGQENTAPWRIGELAERIASGEPVLG